jgi:5-methylcytosine-specific restriction endonuclease McrA
VRIPVVVICCHYDKIPHKTLKLTKSNIVFRDARIDQYTGKEIKGKHDCSIDHVVPLSRGGKSTWENMVLTTKENNLIKGDKLPHEVGFKLIRKPLKPRPVPISIILDKQPFKEWELFLIK